MAFCSLRILVKRDSLFVDRLKQEISSCWNPEIPIPSDEQTLEVTLERVPYTSRATKYM